MQMVWLLDSNKKEVKKTRSIGKISRISPIVFYSFESCLFILGVIRLNRNTKVPEIRG